jgi:cbb3-type cytochrome oxidase maturation protein
MSVLFVAVPVAVLMAASGVIALLWAARGGQLDDLETPPLRMLHEDERRRAGDGAVQTSSAASASARGSER